MFTYEIIKLIISSVYHANLGKNKTIKKITDRMYKPFFKTEIIEIVKTCETCQKIKLKLKETKRRNKYFSVVNDHFTKCIQIHPLKIKQAEDVAKILIDKWMISFGIPESLLSAGGTQYRSK